MLLCCLSLTLSGSNPFSAGNSLRAVVKTAFNEAAKAALRGEISVDVSVTECSNAVNGDYQVFAFSYTACHTLHLISYTMYSAIVRCQSFPSLNGRGTQGSRVPDPWPKR